MVINFYLERQPLPEAISHEITSAGAIGRETAVEPEDLASSMVRFVDTGVVMSYENAKVFHAWMGEKLREMEELHNRNGWNSKYPMAASLQGGRCRRLPRRGTRSGSSRRHVPPTG
jgi:hypothetical protein